MKDRIYLVTTKIGALTKQSLIEAGSRAAAIRWAARAHIDARLATQHDIVEQMKDGATVEIARDPETIDMIEAAPDGNV